MSGEQTGSDFVSEICDLALGKCSDAIRVVFLNPKNNRLPKDLDLRMVSEIKRSTNGSIEVKLLNRIELLKLIAKLVSSAPALDEGGEAESFFSAMDKAAAKLKEDDS